MAYRKFDVKFVVKLPQNFRLFEQRVSEIQASNKKFSQSFIILREIPTLEKFLSQASD